MINAWSLAASILDGTFDKDYPIMKKKKEDEIKSDKKVFNVSYDGLKQEHSDAYYDYKRNDPDAKNPFTDPEDRARAEKVVGNYDKDLEWIENSGGFEWTPGSPWPPSVPEDDGLDYEVDGWDSDEDSMYMHHFTNANSSYNDGWTQEFHKKELEKLEELKMSAHYFKYHEEEILKDIQEYVSSTYQGHYTGTKHEFRKVQTIDLMAARDIAPHFCQANILKYGSRYGSKNGKDKKDLLKVIHYAMLLLHFDGHYGEPSMPTGNIDQIDHNMP